MSYFENNAVKLKIKKIATSVVAFQKAYIGNIFQSNMFFFLQFLS